MEEFDIADLELQHLYTHGDWTSLGNVYCTRSVMKLSLKEQTTKIRVSIYVSRTDDINSIEVNSEYFSSTDSSWRYIEDLMPHDDTKESFESALSKIIAISIAFIAEIPESSVKMTGLIESLVLEDHIERLYPEPIEIPDNVTAISFPTHDGLYNK